MNFGIKEVTVARQIENPKNGRCRGRKFKLGFGIKEVLVVKNLDFAGWPFPESAAAKLKNLKYDFVGWTLL